MRWGKVALKDYNHYIVECRDQDYINYFWYFKRTTDYGNYLLRF